ncbi:ATP-dependent DNA ligase [Brevibacillus dissolubilis]|uniref:ATP-dependent DNA ligase n=1 Tax=Brevibacillus dissolubilis TaxID=1844116 RepID=UPI001117045A|nr:RNA ligase family protein [Brevibacillus dissolubilis]
MEPQSTDVHMPGDNWIAQVKWDGVRILTYHDEDGTRLFNRKKRERTEHFIEINDAKSFVKADSVILDGEVIAFDTDRAVPIPSFHRVMRRDGLRNMDRIRLVAGQVPIMYMVFDLLYLNGESVTHLPLLRRQELLREVISPDGNAHVKLVENVMDGEALFQMMRERDMEGVVLKDLQSPYQPGTKSAKWLKRKFYRDRFAVIGGVTLRDGIVNAVLLGLYDEQGRFRFVGGCGTGKLSRGDWVELTKGIAPLVTEESPFTDLKSGGIWLKPALVIKVQYMSWTSDGHLFQPSLQAFVDVPPQECRLEESRR